MCNLCVQPLDEDIPGKSLGQTLNLKGDRAVSVQTPQLQNDLLDEIEEANTLSPLKLRLKTHF